MRVDLIAKIFKHRSRIQIESNCNIQQSSPNQLPTRKRFCDALISCFNATGKVVAEYWACCLEEHENTSGYHYHASVRLSGPKRWNPVKKRLHEKFGIQVNLRWRMVRMRIASASKERLASNCIRRSRA